MFERPEHHDWKRTGRMGFYAFLVWAPVGHFWFRYLDKLFLPSYKFSLLKKILLDQLFMCPLFLSFFLSSNELLQGKSWTTAVTRLNQDYFDAQIKNWQVWTPAQLINFYLVPLLYRVIFTRIISFFWSIYLSWKGKGFIL